MYNHQLDTFIVASQSKSFSEAADKLFLSTPALIQQINLLEAKVGVPLFIRSHSGIKLTNSGKSLYEDALSIIDLSNKAKENAIRRASETDLMVRIGMFYSNSNEILGTILPELQAEIPNMKISISNVSNILEPLDSCDVIESVKFDDSLLKNYQFKEFTKKGLCCAIPFGNPLCKKSHLTIEDLDNTTIVYPASILSYVFSELKSKTVQAGCHTKFIETNISSATEIINYCAQNNYIYIQADRYKDIFFSIKYLDLDAGMDVPYGLIYRTNNPSPIVNRFVSLAYELYQSQDKSQPNI